MTEATMMQKVGAAILAAEAGWNPKTAKESKERVMARAAIEAMREPPAELLEAMHRAMFTDPFDATNLPMLGAGFDAVIDASLSPTKD